MPFTRILTTDRNFASVFNNIKTQLLADITALDLVGLDTLLDTWEAENAAYDTQLDDIEDDLNTLLAQNTTINNDIAYITAQQALITTLTMPTSRVTTNDTNIANIETNAQTSTPFLTALGSLSTASRLLAQNASNGLVLNATYSNQTLNQWYLGDVETSGTGTAGAWTARGMGVEVYRDSGINTANLGTKSYVAWGYHTFNGVSSARIRFQNATNLGINVDCQNGGGNFGTSCNNNGVVMSAFTASNNALALEYWFANTHPVAATVSLGQTAGTDLTDLYGSILLMSMENA